MAGDHAVSTAMLTQSRPVAPRPDAPDTDPVGIKLARLEAKPSLVIDHVDYEIRNPSAVRARLAAPLAYSQRVEAMVTGLSIETSERDEPHPYRNAHVVTEDKKQPESADKRERYGE